MSTWTRSGSSSSADMHIQYETSPDYPGIERITVRSTYEKTYSFYVIAGKEREFKTPERAMAALAKRSEYAKKAATTFRNPLTPERSVLLGVAAVGVGITLYELLKPKATT